ncbi:MAG: hypothetical protein R3A78_03505 [Polyangiales bacterium]
MRSTVLMLGVLAGVVLVARPAVGQPAKTTDMRPRVDPPASEPLDVPRLDGPLRMHGAKLTQDELLKSVRAAIVTGLRPVGNTSVVFAAELRGSVNAAFRPRQKLKPLGYRAEIAAYRIARLLELDNVPPVVSRMVPVAAVREKIIPEFQAAAEEYVRALIPERVGEQDMVPVAAIYWIPDMRDPGLDASRRVERWTRHLQQSGRVRESELSWHRDIANVLVFDYLIGNPDRWSGSNLQGSHDGMRLYIRDHDLGFPEQDRVDRTRVLLETLMRTQKFSRRTVARLRDMTRASVAAEVAKDPRSREEAILSPAQLDGVMARRDTILSYVDSLVDEYGAERVLVFE